jgi:hypothetical protein
MKYNAFCILTLCSDGGFVAMDVSALLLAAEHVVHRAWRCWDMPAQHGRLSNGSHWFHF